MWYEITLVRNDGAIAFEFNTYDQVLTLFNLLRDTKQYGTRFLCIDNLGITLIDRFVMQDNENTTAANNNHA